VAFDTGPANILMDAWIQNKKSKAYDKDGKLASRGLPDPKVVIQILKHPYFKKKAPKSTGREDFNLKMINQWGGAAFKKLSFNDQLATLVEVTAQSIADSYLSLKHQPKEIFFYGGGVRNPYLLERIRLHLPDMKISLTDDLGWPSQAFESSLFAFLGAARHFNKTVHLPKITGAKKATPLGSLC
jgi:anhydro-N-acetylmuramic acid kinase